MKKTLGLWAFVRSRFETDEHSPIMTSVALYFVTTLELFTVSYFQMRAGDIAWLSSVWVWAIWCLSGPLVIAIVTFLFQLRRINRWRKNSNGDYSQSNRVDRQFAVAFAIGAAAMIAIAAVRTPEPDMLALGIAALLSLGANVAAISRLFVHAYLWILPPDAGKRGIGK